MNIPKYSIKEGTAGSVGSWCEAFLRSERPKVYLITCKGNNMNQPYFSDIIAHHLKSQIVDQYHPFQIGIGRLLVLVGGRSFLLRLQHRSMFLRS